jgi:hypothetical protein
MVAGSRPGLRGSQKWGWTRDKRSSGCLSESGFGQEQKRRNGKKAKDLVG